MIYSMLFLWFTTKSKSYPLHHYKIGNLLLRKRLSHFQSCQILKSLKYSFVWKIMHRQPATTKGKAAESFTISNILTNRFNEPTYFSRVTSYDSNPLDLFLPTQHNTIRRPFPHLLGVPIMKFLFQAPFDSPECFSSTDPLDICFQVTEVIRNVNLYSTHHKET